MSTPFVRSRSNIVVSYGDTLKIPVSAASAGDCVIVYLEGVDWFGGSGGGSPQIPSFITQLYLNASSGGFKYLGWGKVPPAGLAGAMTFTAGAGMTTSGGWWGHVDVIANVAWSLPGWVDTNTPLSNYTTLTRSDLSTPPSTNYTVWVQAEFNSIGVTNRWLFGWANGDVGFGLNTSGRPIIFINNTLGNPIGNVAANADIPGFATAKKMWLRADINPSSGNCSYYYSYDPVPQFDSVKDHWTQIGTTVAGTNGGTTPRLTNSDTVFIGTRDAATTNFDGKIYAVEEAVDFVLTVDLNFSNPLPGNVALVGTANHIRSTSQDLGYVPFDRWAMCDGICFLSNTSFSLPAVDVPSADHLIYDVLRGGTFSPHSNIPVTGPAAWTAWTDRAAEAQGFKIKYVTRSLPADADVAAAPVGADGNYAFQYHFFSFVGRQLLVELPPLPQTDVIRLGCADSYTAWITEADYMTTIDEFRWTQITWERVLDDISTARVTVPDELGGTNCIARFNALCPWQYGLQIDRNDRKVWSGPIRNVQRQGNAIVINAADSLARMQKRFVIRNLVVPYTNADAGLIFADILNTHSRQAADQFTIDCPDFVVNVPVTRTLRPRGGKYAWDLLSELLDTAVDGYMMNGSLYVWAPNFGWRYHDQIDRTFPGPYNDSFELVYGTFTEESFATRPDWSIDGAGQGNFVLSATSDVGELGFRQFETVEDEASEDKFGVLDLIDPSTLEVPEDQTPSETSKALRARAESLLRLRSYAPVVMEGGALSRNAPIDIENLRPGGLWVTDVFDAGYGQLLSVVRLRRVSVQVALRDGGIDEKISPVLYPPGWSGDMANA